MREKIKELINKTAEKGDAFLIVSPVNRRYVTGFNTSDGFVIIKNGELTFITDFRYFEMAELAKKDGKIPSEIRLVLQQSAAMKQLADELCGCETVLFEDRFLSVEYLGRLRKFMPDKHFVSGSAIINSCRESKDAYEIDCIKKSQGITDLAYRHILNVISDNVGKPDFTENDIALELEFFMRKNCSEGVDFDTISVSGHKSSLPHGVGDSTPVQKGFLTMDFGAKYNGYCSDMTRTICIGAPNEKMKLVYNTVLQAQLAALEQIRGNILGNVADAFARSVIDNAGFKGKFGHSLGHSLGLDIHESPNFSPNEKNTVPVNAVISVEPGIYLPGEFGVRIEDIVRLTEDGCENLTHSPKELTVI